MLYINFVCSHVDLFRYFNDIRVYKKMYIYSRKSTFTISFVCCIYMNIIYIGIYIYKLIAFADTTYEHIQNESWIHKKKGIEVNFCHTVTLNKNNIVFKHFKSILVVRHVK